MKNSITLLLALAMVFGVMPTTYAFQDATPKLEAKAAETEKKDPAAEYEKAVKDFQRVEGPITLYTNKKGKTYVELSESDIGKVFYLQCTAASGIISFIQPGTPLGGFEVAAYRWQMSADGENVNIVQPKQFYRNGGKMLETALNRSFPESIIDTYKIEQRNPDKKLLLVDVSSIFNGKLNYVDEIANFIMGSMTAKYSIDARNSSYEAQGFPENTVVHSNLTFRRTEGLRNPEWTPLTVEDERNIPFNITFNLWYPKKSDYMPRQYDDRIGYFTQDFYDFDKFLEKKRMEHLIMRWNLKKKDPSAALSEPVKPIVWTLDSSIPKEYRPAFRDGILRWNRAFEKLGYKNAIQVQDCEDVKDYNYSDGRFNVIRWTMSQNSGYAIALFRCDPFTGEILNAGINFDFNFLRYTLLEHDNYSDYFGNHPNAAKLLITPEKFEDKPNLNLDLKELLMSKEEIALKQFKTQLAQTGVKLNSCEYVEGLVNQMTMNYDFISSLGTMKMSKEAYVHEVLANTICHEIGHCLGLRHNFVGSQNLTAEQLCDDYITEEQGTTASVMDYVGANLYALLKGTGRLFNSKIGAYDEWAIQYGYSDSGANTPEGEKPFLGKIAAQSGMPGHQFMTDDDKYDLDNSVFDLGRGHLPYVQAKQKLYDLVIKKTVATMPKVGESYNERCLKLAYTAFVKTTNLMEATNPLKYDRLSRSHYGDPNSKPPLQTVSSAEKRAVVRYILDTAFSKDPLGIPADQAKYFGAIFFDGRPVAYSNINGMIEISVLEQLFDKRILGYLQFSQPTTPEKDRYTLQNYFDDIFEKIFPRNELNVSVNKKWRKTQSWLTMIFINQSMGGAVAEQGILYKSYVYKLQKRFQAQLASPKGLDAENIAAIKTNLNKITNYLRTSPVQTYRSY